MRGRASRGEISIANKLHMVSGTRRTSWKNRPKMSSQTLSFFREVKDRHTISYVFMRRMLSTESSPTLSSEEQEQILQTIEMFEVITQANPQDCQSMDILKDAYQRVGKQKEALSVARRLGDTYVELGQYSAAMLEYEGILQKDPDNAEVIAALGDVEDKLQKSGQLKPP